MRFGWQLTVSYSFKQTSNSAFFFVLQNVSKSKKCQLLSAGGEHNIYVKMQPLTVILCMFCAHKPCCEHPRWADTPHKPTPWHSWCHASEYRRRNLGSSHQATQTENTHINILNFLPQGKHVVISIFIVTAVTTTLLTVNTSKHQQLFFYKEKNSIWLQVCRVKKTPIFLLLRKKSCFN